MFVLAHVFSLSAIFLSAVSFPSFPLLLSFPFLFFLPSLYTPSIFIISPTRYATAGSESGTEPRLSRQYALASRQHVRPPWLPWSVLAILYSSVLCHASPRSATSFSFLSSRTVTVISSTAALFFLLSFIPSISFYLMKYDLSIRSLH